MNAVSSSALYQKIITAPTKINWLDILGGASQKHSENDTDYAMIAGTSLDTVTTGIGMLQKWQKPWLYRRVLVAGAMLTLVMLGAVLAVMLLYGSCPLPALTLLMIMIPPCVVPVSLMVLFWEMNAPRDISLVQMIGYFFTGGILSILFTMIFTLFLPINAIAPITEEPAKLLISLYFLQRIYKKRGRVYGFTGLAVGAAVGAGFAAFESAQYAYNCLPTIDLEGIAVSILLVNWSSIIPVLVNIAIRAIFALCGHVLFCAPYVCIAALNMENGGDMKTAVQSKSFWVVFAVSFVSHWLWNEFAGWIAAVVFVIVLWSTALYGIRRSFVQIVKKVNVTSGTGSAVTPLRIQGSKGVHAGVAFALTHNEVLIGNDASCHLNYPVSMTEIGKTHCKLLVQNGGLYLADLGSQSGTYLNGAKLKPMTGYLLKQGDRFCIGSNEQEFVVI